MIPSIIEVPFTYYYNNIIHTIMFLLKSYLLYSFIIFFYIYSFFIPSKKSFSDKQGHHELSCAGQGRRILRHNPF
jgi:hypothetical protein